MNLKEWVGLLWRNPLGALKYLWQARSRDSSHTDSFYDVKQQEMLHLCRRHAVRRLELKNDVLNQTHDVSQEGRVRHLGSREAPELKEPCIEGRDRSLTGLALSGGGIRSASFASGLLQALAEEKYLESFDYLSTVSGGGYAGTALTWSMHQASHTGANDFINTMVNEVQDTKEYQPMGPTFDIPLLKHIRRRANYLSPNDTISLMVGLLNTIRMSVTSVLIYAVLTIAMIMPVVWLYDRAADGMCMHGDPFAVAMQWSMQAGQWLSAISGISNFLGQDRIAWVVRSYLELGEHITNELAPVYFGTNDAARECLSRFSALVACLLVGIYILYFLSLVLLYAFIHSFEASRRNRVGALTVFTTVTTIIFGLLVLSIVPILLSYSDNLLTNENFQIGTVAAALTSGVSFALSMIKRFGERIRILLTRLAALLLAVLALTIVLAMAFAIARNIPGTFFEEKLPTDMLLWALLSIVAGTLVSAFLQALQARFPKPKWLNDVVVMFFTLSSAWVVVSAAYYFVVTSDWLWPGQTWMVFFRLLAVLFVVVTLFNFLNPNNISSHRFYRDRLMETFMPSQPASNFRAADDAQLCKMFSAHIPAPAGQAEDTPQAERYAGPYHIVNTNVILVRSQRPEFYQRGGDSFILSPLYCGSGATGWIKTEDHSIRLFKRDTSLTLATAMAISGAAANPNTAGGEDTTMRRWSISFLMTLLNIRLGLWQPNPASSKKQFRRETAQPSFVTPGVLSLLSNYYDETKRYIELSDGGHFDNTGLYELFRREVKIIVLSDASCDPDYSMDDLSRALVLAHADFGVAVDFQGLDAKKSAGIWKKLDESPEQPNTYRGKGYPWVNDGVRAKILRDGYAVGTITYPTQSEPGYLIYIKPALIEYAPLNALSYAINNPDFPHQSTAEQFFSELRFEAYRSLGHAIGKKVVTEIFA